MIFLGIDVLIALAPMGSVSSGQFRASVSNEGSLGSIGALLRSPADVMRDIDVAKKFTNRNFEVNHIPQTPDEEAFRYTPDARPAVITFTLVGPGAKGSERWC